MAGPINDLIEQTARGLGRVGARSGSEVVPQGAGDISDLVEQSIPNQQHPELSFADRQKLKFWSEEHGPRVVGDELQRMGFESKPIPYDGWNPLKHGQYAIRRPGKEWYRIEESGIPSSLKELGSDIADYAGDIPKDIGGMVGGALGFAGGGAAGGPLGAGGGALGGAMAGGMAAQGLKQSIGEALGYHDLDYEEATEGMAREGLIQGAGELGGRYVIDPAMRAAGRGLKRVYMDATGRSASKKPLQMDFFERPPPGISKPPSQEALRATGDIPPGAPELSLPPEPPDARYMPRDEGFKKRVLVEPEAPRSMAGEDVRWMPPEDPDARWIPDSPEPEPRKRMAPWEIEERLDQKFAPPREPIPETTPDPRVPTEDIPAIEPESLPAKDRAVPIPEEEPIKEARPGATWELEGDFKIPKAIEKGPIGEIEGLVTDDKSGREAILRQMLKEGKTPEFDSTGNFVGWKAVRPKKKVRVEEEVFEKEPLDPNKALHTKEHLESADLARQIYEEAGRETPNVPLEGMESVPHHISTVRKEIDAHSSGEYFRVVARNNDGTNRVFDRVRIDKPDDFEIKNLDPEGQKRKKAIHYLKILFEEVEPGKHNARYVHLDDVVSVSRSDGTSVRFIRTPKKRVRMVEGVEPTTELPEPSKRIPRGKKLVRMEEVGPSEGESLPADQIPTKRAAEKPKIEMEDLYAPLPKEAPLEAVRWWQTSGKFAGRAIEEAGRTLQIPDRMLDRLVDKFFDKYAAPRWIRSMTKLAGRVGPFTAHPALGMALVASKVTGSTLENAGKRLQRIAADVAAPAAIRKAAREAIKAGRRSEAGAVIMRAVLMMILESDEYQGDEKEKSPRRTLRVRQA